MAPIPDWRWRRPSKWPHHESWIAPMNHKGLDRERIVAEDALAGQIPFGPIWACVPNGSLPASRTAVRRRIPAVCVAISAGRYRQRVLAVLKACRLEPIAALRAE